jgi:hypothetical protein
MDRKDARRQGTARVVGLHDDDGSFDGTFWRRIPPAERLEMVWSMALEAGQWKGERGGQPRLQRSVCRVERRRSKVHVVGGYAVAFHAAPRFTKDLDVWTEPTAANAARVPEAWRGRAETS